MRKRAVVALVVLAGILAIAVWILSPSAKRTIATALAPKPPLTRPASMTNERWIAEWQKQLPVEATLTQGTTPQLFAFNSDPLRAYKLKLRLANQTGYEIPLGRELYVVETSTPGKESPLTIAGGYFRVTPPEDYSGVVEYRGGDDATVGDLDAAITRARETDALTSMGLLNSLAYSSVGTFRNLGPMMEFMTGSKPKAETRTFGAMPPGKDAVIESELRLAVMIEKERLSTVYIVTPAMAPTEPGSSVLRYVLKMKREPQKKKDDDTQWSLAEARLLPMTAETLHPIVKDAQGELWRRVFAARWLADCAKDSGPALLEIAKGKENAALRASAITSLGLLKHAPAHPALAEVAKSTTEPLSSRAAAILALGRIGNSAALPLLRDLTREEESSLDDEAVTALGLLGDRAAAPTLLDILDDENQSDLHTYAASAISRIADDPAVDRLTNIARSGRLGADDCITALGRVGSPKAVASLVSVYDQGSVEVRQNVCRSIGHLDRPEVTALLERALAEKEAGVRTAALDGAAKAKSAERQKLLIGALDDRDPAVQQAAMGRIGELMVGGASDRLTAIAREKSGNADIRGTAITTLASINGEKATPLLFELLADPTPAIRRSSIDALGTAREKKALPKLALLLKDSDASVRSAAARAIGDVGTQTDGAMLVDALLLEKDVDCIRADVGAIIELEYKDRKAFSRVVDRIQESDADTRMSLQRLLENWSGEDLGAAWSADEAEVRKSVAKWREWEKSGKK